MIRRRILIAALGATATAWPAIARAQKPPARIGFMYSGSATSAASERVIRIIKQGLADNGLSEGRDYLFDVRFADGDYQRFPAMARELARAGAKVILASTIPSVRAAQQLDPPVPVVITVVLDPVGNGLIDSLAHPGRHTTGVALLNADLTSKLLEIQRTVLPNAKVVGALYNPASPAGLVALQKLQAKAPSLGFAVAPFALRLPEELDGVFAAIAAQPPDTLQIITDAAVLDFAPRITDLALRQKLPTFAESRGVPDGGGLLSYGPQLKALFLRAASFAARIVRGGNPDDLPVEQPTLIELVINMKTAKALGLAIPPTILARADEVIE